MDLLPTIAASLVILMVPKAGLTDNAHERSAPIAAKSPARWSEQSAKRNPKARSGGNATGPEQSRKAQFKVNLFPASRGRSAPDEAAPSNDVVRGGAVTSSESPRTARGGFLCPSGMVMIGEKFCIDAWEAALVEVLPDGRRAPWSPYFPPKPGGVYSATTQPGVFPQGYISGVEAKAACEQAGKRLCQPAEWKKACMGPKETIWGYGNQHQAKRCNDHGISSMHFFNKGLSDKPEDKWKWGAAGNMMDPRLNQLEGTLARTGDHPDCTNEYGVFDMVGNVHEWVDDPAGTFQGGYYLDTHLNADGCYYRTTAHDVKHSDYSTGFRCCADVDSL